MTTLVLKDVDDDLYDRLSLLARANKISVEAQATAMLKDVSRTSQNERVAIARSIAALTPSVGQTDSVELLRQDRDR